MTSPTTLSGEPHDHKLTELPTSPSESKEAGLAEFQLFRPEALADARDRLGSPARLIGLSAGGLTAFLAALFLCVTGALAIMSYARKETVPGVLTPTTGAMHVVVPRAGVIAAVHVRNDQQVVKGQPLVSLESDTTVASGERVSDLLSGAADDQASALELQTGASASALRSARAQIIQRRLVLTRQLAQVRSNIGILRERLRLAEETATASRLLHERQFLSTMVLRQREDAVLASRQSILAAEGTLAELPASIAALDAEEAKLMSDGARDGAALSLQIAQLRERRVSIGANSNVQLVAPQTGRIAVLHAKPGTAVSPNSNIVTILPPGALLEAELWVPSRAIGFIRRGDRVRLMYDAFPFEKFGAAEGQVIYIDRTPTAPVDLGGVVNTEEALYRVLVKVKQQEIEGYGRSWPLVPGMRLSADIILENQTILGWMFDQVRASVKRAGA